MLLPLIEIEKISGRKDKESYLSNLSGVDAENFKKAADLCYGKLYSFGISKDSLPSFMDRDESRPATRLDEALDILKEAGLGEGFGSEEKRSRLTGLMSSMIIDDQEVLIRILRGNLGCGVSSGTVNKVWPNTIFVPPYMRCDTLNKKNLAKIDPPYYVQTKLDGKFVNVVCDTDKKDIRFYSRDWNDCTERYRTESHIDMIDEMTEIGFDPVVLHGEIRVIDEEGNIMDREDGNGYLNREEIDKNRVVFQFWDAVPLDAFFGGSFDEVYSSRLAMTSQIVEETGCDNFSVAHTQLAETPEDVKRMIKAALSSGEEGIVVKNRHGKWKSGTSPSRDQLKGKIAVDCDVRIVGYELSTETKYAGQIASIVVESSCGGLLCNVGGGLKDDARADLERFDQYVKDGKIVKVRYNGVVDNDLRPEYKSLYLQRIIEFRDDKDEADSLEKIIEQLDTFEIDV